MFYILVSRVPFIYNVTDKKSKVFRTFLVGSICYIIVHGLLYSKKFVGNSFVDKYKQYLMYLAGIDLSLTLGIIYFLDNKSKMEENLFIEDGGEEEQDDSNEEDTIADNKMTREEILAQYYQAQQNQQNQQNPKDSPFIKKGAVEELKKADTETSKSKKLSSKKKEITQSSASTQVTNDKNVNVVNNNEELNQKKSQESTKSDNKELDNLVELISNTEIPVYQSTTA